MSEKNEVTQTENGTVPRSKKRTCARHCKRFWWVYLIILCVIVVIVVPVISTKPSWKSNPFESLTPRVTPISWKSILLSQPMARSMPRLTLSRLICISRIGQHT
ncbi:hypothetical protein LB505_007984 [Fusarium chuoi]|nr:hypothetical protein LB505_007984 [Fusarium chuoi]